jgi:dTMP kinase
LARGAVVISDRYVDSSLAYQGAGRTLPVQEISWLSSWATGGLKPDLVVLLDIEPSVGLGRVDTRGLGVDRLESESRAFHDRVRYAFLDLAAADPKRYLVLDASRPADEIADTVARRIESLLEAGDAALRAASATDTRPGVDLGAPDLVAVTSEAVPPSAAAVPRSAVPSAAAVAVPADAPSAAVPSAAAPSAVALPADAPSAAVPSAAVPSAVALPADAPSAAVPPAAAPSAVALPADALSAVVPLGIRDDEAPDGSVGGPPEGHVDGPSGSSGPSGTSADAAPGGPPGASSSAPPDGPSEGPAGAASDDPSGATGGREVGHRRR